MTTPEKRAGYHLMTHKKHQDDGHWAPIGVGEGDLELVEEAHNKHTERKAAPVFSGVMHYFPDAIWEVARCSKIGNDQHNDPTKPMHWDRAKSTDEPDALLRHLMQYDQLDSDGLLHATKVAWRSLALLQKCLESRGEAPLSPHNTNQ